MTIEKIAVAQYSYDLQRFLFLLIVKERIIDDKCNRQNKVIMFIENTNNCMCNIYWTKVLKEDSIKDTVVYIFM